MKRKMLCLLLSLIIVLMIVPTATLAANHRSTRAEQMRLERMVTSANRRVEMLVSWAKFTPYNDVAWLLDSVDKTVAPVFEYARRIGAVVVCEYITYCIDGQYVDIDPLRVVSL